MRISGRGRSREDRGGKRRDGELGEACGVRVAPHCAYFGPCFPASAHLVATIVDRSSLERLFIDLEADLFGGLTQATAGAIKVPTGPALGCDPDPAVIVRYEVIH